jgi:glycosyltransferase involved in cell wall biosynthesis
MKICIVSKTNGHGLAKDIKILLGSIPSHYEVSVRSHKEIRLIECFQRNKYDLAIDLEVPHLKSPYIARNHIVIPNQEIMQLKHLRMLSRNSIIWAKTKHAAKIFKSRGLQVRYLGFKSEDLTDVKFSRKWNSILHVAGKSPNRGTSFIIELWRMRQDYPKIQIVQNSREKIPNLTPNIEVINEYLSDDDIRQLRNTCGIQICPSQVEGWGHNIVEGMGVGAVVVTLNAPPMNEHITNDRGYLITSTINHQHGLDESSVPDMGGFEDIMDQIFSTDEKILSEKGSLARNFFLHQNKKFDIRLRELLSEFVI